MRIDRLELQNFRCFSRYQVEFAPRFTLIIGDNASGKTAMLEALAVAAGSFFLGITMEGVERRIIQRDDIRLAVVPAGGSLKLEEQSPNVVMADGEVGGRPIRWGRSLSDPKGKTRRQDANSIRDIARDLGDRARAGEPVALPIIAYYGSGRLFQSLKERSTPVEAFESRLAGYDQCLNPASDPKRLFVWLKAQELAALQKAEPRPALEAVRAAIVSLVPGTKRVYWDPDLDDLVIVAGHASGDRITLLQWMNDGHRNLVGLAADIAYRMAVLNPHLLADAVRETPGIVLIDDLDLHLHPTWRRAIVGALLRAFPRVQFIATTHSPFIIQGLHGVAGAMLWDLNTSTPMPVETKSIEDIAEDKQGVEIPQQSRRFLDMMRAAEQYYGLLRGPDGHDPARREELKEELDRLSLPYSNEPAFQAFLHQRRLAAGPNGSPDA